MKPYGVPRCLSWEYPDKADCMETGAKSRHMKMKSKNRRGARRFWAKHARREARNIVRKELAAA